jgi:uncharacterized protein YkuJ
MKAWQLFPLAMALLMAGCSESPTVAKKTDWETQGLLGNVKQLKLLNSTGYRIEGDSVVLITDSMRVTSVNRFNDIGQVTEIEYYDKGKFVRTQINMYDDKGNKLEVHSVNPDGSLREKSHYEFDANGKIVKRTNFQPDTLYSVRNYTIDANGNTTAETEYYSNGNLRHRILTPYDENSKRTEYIFEIDGKKVSWMKYRYDELSRMVEMTTLDSLGGIIINTSNKFNEQGKIIETTIFNRSSGETLYLNKYNEEGELAERLSRPSDGSPEIRTTFRYDEKGATIETIQYNSDNSITSIRKLDIVYDSKGNWIRRINYLNDSISLPILVREIEYYE